MEATAKGFKTETGSETTLGIAPPQVSRWLPIHAVMVLAACLSRRVHPKSSQKLNGGTAPYQSGPLLPNGEMQSQLQAGAQSFTFPFWAGEKKLLGQT